MLVHARGLCRSIGVLVVFWSILAAGRAQGFAGGTGEPNDPYQIATAEQLISIGSDPNLLDKHFVLIDDVDLDPNLPGGRVFTQAVMAAGTSSKVDSKVIAFTGTLNGDGHTIRNLSLSAPSAECVGLLGALGPNAVITNLGIENAKVTADTAIGYTGSLAGWNEGRITNCHGTGSVAGRSHVGGLVGWNGGQGIITGCWGTSVVSAVSGYAMVIGGLVGLNSGRISCCYANGSVVGSNSLGGLVGRSSGRIIDCYADVDICGREPSLDLGGLCGDNSGAIIRCYATSSIRMIDGTAWDLGGLVGVNSSGRLAEATVVNCFWNTTISGISMSDGGMALTTGQMMAPEVYSLNGWAGDPNWLLDDGNDSPRLAWEGRPGHTIPEPVVDWFGGKGTPDDPFVVATTDQLAHIGTASILWDKVFVLSSDLDLTAVVLHPIGVCLGTAFDGTFDGGNHVLSNMTMDSGEVLTSQVGLFGYIGPGGCVRRLTVRNATIGGTSVMNVGILAGASHGTVTECAASGTISCGKYSSLIGGLIGVLRDGMVSKCCATANINAKDGSSAIGGLIGYIGWGDITECYSTGSVSAGNKSNSVGGLVGQNLGSVNDSYWSGEIRAGNESYQIGGLVGELRGRIMNCHAAGAVFAGGPSKRIGGLVGYRDFAEWEESVKNSFWDTETSGLLESDGGSGLTSTQMRSEKSFIGWDFDETWTICEGEDYPRLRWERVQCQP